MEVWKYTLETGTKSLAVPLDAKFLYVAVQYGEPQLWALVNPKASKEIRQIRIVGTGHYMDLSNTYEHLGSFLLEGGALVFHVFEIK